jgi:hypothetical protein
VFRSLEELYLDMFVGDSADDQVSMDDFSFGIEKLQLQVSHSFGFVRIEQEIVVFIVFNARVCYGRND